LKERKHYEDLDVDGRIILKCVLEKEDGGMDWIYLTEDKDQLQALVNMVIILQIP
jgi:hypothetical protein